MPKIRLSSAHEFLPEMKPAKKYLPEWYAKMPLFIGGKYKIGSNGNANLGAKACVPFLDSFMTGYTAELWCDILVTRDEGYAKLQTVGTNQPPFTVRGGEGTFPMPTPIGYEETHFAWINPYMLKLPKGYSCLITHPLNRYELPFQTLSGIVDADQYLLSTGRLPFFIKKDFEGVIEKGTPMYQVIPFKRENWTSEQDPSLRKEGDKKGFDFETVLYGWYKKFAWTKKEYN